ncbi:lipopolysaccharide biosynthesis protein [Tabrizicola sp. YIM 78059]|uniref:lipopolysaccharide biosynthesis protein n=1 Tax=Tabrizicola sp. YIM 78059 TaxID=2529861 RepID=UPI0010AB1BBE|nr:lipopolysaccharide biosynthesis protein [Tabrizicola sp. YIM 78059]
MTNLTPNAPLPASGEVISVIRPNATQRGQSSPVRSYRGILLSFIVFVCLPLLAATAYYAAIATDRYAARAGFSVRGMDMKSGVDGLGAITGLASSGSTTSDSYIVLSYLGSRELVEALDRELDLRGVYSSANVDPLSRLAQDATIEDFVAYWQRHIHTQFDPASGIIEFEVQSFSADHARRIGDMVLTLTQKLVNDLSASARNDALRFAREDVALQEARLRKALTAIRDFRASEQSVDPSASAALEVELIAGLESRLSDLNARIAALSQTLDDNAPSLVALRRDAEALTAEILQRRKAIGGDASDSTGSSAVTRQLAIYEELEVERSLAQQAYASALASLEQARRDADRQQRYLAIHLRPQTAESAKYPRSLRNLFVLGFALFAAWGIGVLLTMSVRDHLT